LEQIKINLSLQAHFEWLSPDDTSEGAKVFDYADLFREAADALKEAGLFEEALRYYGPLQLTEGYADVRFFMAMGDCAVGCARYEEAEAYFLTVVENDATNLDARMNLARLYEALGMDERALKYVNQAVILGREETGRRRRRKDHRIERLAREFRAAGDDTAFMSTDPNIPLQESFTTEPSAFPQAEPEHDSQRPLHVEFLYSKMSELRPSMRQGDADATEDWLDIADALLRDFRSNRVFYPLQKNTIFLGYSREAQRKVGKNQNKTVLDEMLEMAGRLQESMGMYQGQHGTLSVSILIIQTGKHPSESLPTAIPNDYYGISFDEWLDIFMEYAFVVSGQGEKEEAYDTLAAAADASVWHHSKDKVRKIHICIISRLLYNHSNALTNDIHSLCASTTG
jgi:general transcription factor 3C polypeptide 3 (transcription factor C subunit 4)